MELGRFMRTTLLLSAALFLACSPAVDSPRADLPDLDTLHAALSERDELERAYLLSRYLRELDTQDLPDALEAIEAHRVGISADETRLLMLVWTRFDGPGAYEAASSWPTPWRKTLTQQMMQAWGFNDGRAAHTAWETIEDEDLKSSLRPFLVAGWEASDDREGVSEFAATIEEPKLRNRVALRIAGQAMRDGPDAVIEWAEAVPVDAPNDFKKIVIRHAASALARVDPDRAARWYESVIDQPYAAGALRKIAQKWALHHDPTSLIRWIETLPLDDSSEVERLDAVGVAVRFWAANEPAEVEEWLASEPPGPVRDTAIIEFARATVDASPEEALEWVGLVLDDADRRKNTLRSWRQWFRNDPHTARAWLGESDIPQAWQRQLLSDLPRRRANDDKQVAEPDA